MKLDNFRVGFDKEKFTPTVIFEVTMNLEVIQDDLKLIRRDLLIEILGTEMLSQLNEWRLKRNENN